MLRAELAVIACELRALKPWARQPRKDRGLQPSARFCLMPTKERATWLCTIMAHSRGRVHRRHVHDLAGQAAALAAYLDRLDLGRGLPLLDGNIRAAARVILASRASPEPACVALTEERRV